MKVLLLTVIFTPMFASNYKSIATEIKRERAVTSFMMKERLRCTQGKLNILQLHVNDDDYPNYMFAIQNKLQTERYMLQQLINELDRSEES